MTKIDSPPRRRFVLVPVVGALVAIIVGAVLYETARPAGKAASDCPADSVRLAAKLAPMAKDDLAALTVASEPRRAEQFAFEREDGGKLTLADFRGRAVLLNLWATWCVPCRAEMPALDRLQAAKGDQSFEVVAVNIDTARLERRAAFLDSVGVKALARYADPSGDAFETLRRDGKALGLPVTLIIDKDGCEVGAVEGGIKWDSAEAQALVGALKGG
ncbi:MAG: TlpA disulfide reductase family protein [Roseiarcus sp.]